MFHVLIVPKSPPPKLIIDPDAARADELLMIFRRNNIFRTHGLLFREFVAQYEAGTFRFEKK